MERRGTLKNWNDRKGFGFIRPEQGGEDVFAHISVVHGERRPLVGDRVLYVAGRDTQGRLRAEHLRLDAPLALDQPKIR
ncbi:cold shock domain-containing protein, partial [Pseudomonas stutzeri]|nr:cold shock domain-containing protein [Stutzerimonas degradans]